MKVLEQRSIDYNFILSGQHRDTIDSILENFSISKRPDTELYKGPDITGIVQMLKWAMTILRQYGSPGKAPGLFKNDRNGIVLNHGDTLSTLLGSLLARRHGLKNAHIESGLRSRRLFHPFPEELTRLLTFRLSDYFFAPGQWALDNLKKYPGIKINTLHNTLYDAMQISSKSAGTPMQQRFALISLHRFENIFSRRRLAHIIDSLLADPLGMKKLFILHKPTELKLREFGLYSRLQAAGDIELHPRYDYFSFMRLLRASEYLITDGGSNQEECSYLGKPCLLIRKATERREGLGHNTVLSAYEPALISDFMANYQRYRQAELTLAQSPSEIIVDSLLEFSA